MEMNSKSDKLYQGLRPSLGSFQFDDQVAAVFDDMIARSVPGYLQILSLLPTLTRHVTQCVDQPTPNFYDLGCSTGAGLLAMAEGLGNTPAKLCGIDNAPSMIEKAGLMTQSILQKPNLSLELHCADINQQTLSDAAMVLMNFTLQFIPLEQRDALVKKVFTSLHSGGLFVLSEKLQSDDQKVDHLLTNIHHQYKFDQGYSELEISRKRDAIENVLIPETLHNHEQRLRSAGFKTVTPWIRNLQFVSIIAVKD